MKQPSQPVVWDKTGGKARFKENKIVNFLRETSKFNMHDLAMMEFSVEDRQQFMQLIGYSVDGFAELSFASKSEIKKADAQAAVLRAKHVKKKKKAA